MTKEQFKAIAKVCMRAKSDIDNILAEDANFHITYNNGMLSIDCKDGTLNSTPLCDIDTAIIHEFFGFFVKEGEF